ncbi:IMV membrane protein [Deerpox virus W-1170-84]|uniref:IMV membrane protein n=1 Tax=Deerpox virus (strain W-1170-84) TaxID=305676 RepID=Q08F53_DPV84|nr:IMV membrane protein [Deerpox virus W-1170-84]AUI80690.1 IMv membrane protein [White-tailed deer poxvirus]AYC44795.1 IMV membrane protein [Moosepox virus GoldyGopher14]
MNEEEDINESNFIHLLTNLSNNDTDSEFSATLLTVKEIISQINLRVLSINKKSKKNSRQNEQQLNYVPRRENTRY